MNDIDKYIEKLRSDALIHSYNFQGYSTHIKNEIANYLEELKVTKKALELACARLSVTELDCKNHCVDTDCDTYYNDGVCANTLVEYYLDKARSELGNEY